jgi:transposase
LLTDGQGIPLVVQLTKANSHDIKELIPMVDAIPHLQGRRGRPRQRPDRLFADRGYDSQRHREQLRQRGIRPYIAKRRTEHGSHLGRFRWVVERTIAWLHKYRRLRVRFEQRADIHCAFLELGAALICWDHIKWAFC